MAASLDFIIPAYNAEGTIGDTLRSLIAQTSHAWRAVVVDDGSTDRTSDIAETIARGSAGRIRVMRQPNGGVAAARNNGFEASGVGAAGSLVCFLDADDVVNPAYVERMTAAIGDADLVACAYSYAGPELEPAGWVVTLSPDDHRLEQLAEVNPFSIGGIVFRREVLRRACSAGPLFGGTSRHEDWELLLELTAGGACWASAVVEPLFTYRLRPGSRTTSLRPMWRDGLALIQQHHPDSGAVAQVQRRWSVRCLARSLAAADVALAREIIGWLAGIGPSDEGVLAGALRWAVRREVVSRSMSECDAAAVAARVRELLGAGLVARRVAERLVEVPGYWARVARNAAARLGSRQTLVIYGMGRNGRELARHLDEYPIRVAYVDDAPPVEVALPRLASHELGPDHVVIVTPDEREALLRRLAGTPVADVWLPEQLAASVARAAEGIAA